MIRIIGLKGIPLIKRGDDLGAIIVEAAETQGLGVENWDVVVVTQKIVSKAEGRLVDLENIEPSDYAVEIAEKTGKDPKHVEVILRESTRIVKRRGGVLITETKNGFVCANAGVDRSNVEDGLASLLPENADESARQIRERVQELTGMKVAVIITDTWGRPWRLGQVDFAVGVAGMSPFRNYRGETGLFGYQLNVTNIAVADELASAAELVKGKLKKIPVVIIRGYDYPKGEGSAKGMVRPIGEDLFR